MTHLDEQTRQALLRRDDPPLGAREAVLARVLGGAGFDPGGGGDDGGAGGSGLESSGSGAGGWGSAAAAPSGIAAFAAKVVGATVAMTASGLLLVAGVGRVAVDRDSKARPSVAIETSVAERPEVDHPTVGVDPSLLPIAIPASGRRVSQRSYPEPEPPTAETDLEAELALLDAARQAAGPGDALVHLEAHKERFGAGALSGEREVLRIETLCKLGRHADARTAARSLLAKHPTGPLRSRIVNACPGIEG